MAPWMIETIGMLAAIMGTIGWLPQAMKTIRTRETKDLSLWTNAMLLAAVSLWLVYGIMIGSWPVVLGNIVSIVLVGAIVVLKIRHG
ncbi:MAG: SemiSWEET transporter [Devosiaceae bacterium]|nr:SemiSWEET transporter [Devosiaceae bacterium]